MIGGLAGADALCQSAAGAAGLSGAYKAILSDESTDARDRLTLSDPIVNAFDGTTVASTNLWVGAFTAQLKRISDGGSNIWMITGTNSDDTRAPGLTCSSWTSSSGSSRNGDDRNTSSAWIHWGNKFVHEHGRTLLYRTLNSSAAFC